MSTDGIAAHVGETLKELITTQKEWLGAHMAEVLEIIDRPGFPAAVSGRDRSTVCTFARLIRQSHALYVSKTRIAPKALAAAASADERRVLEAAQQIQAQRPSTRGARRTPAEQVAALRQRSEAQLAALQRWADGPVSPQRRRRKG